MNADPKPPSDDLSLAPSPPAASSTSNPTNDQPWTQVLTKEQQKDKCRQKKVLNKDTVTPTKTSPIDSSDKNLFPDIPKTQQQIIDLVNNMDATFEKQTTHLCSYLQALQMQTDNQSTILGTIVDRINKQEVTIATIESGTEKQVKQTVTDTLIHYTNAIDTKFEN